MFVYLASPYTAPSAQIMHERYAAAASFVARRLEIEPEHTVYSPIVHYHPIALQHSLPKSFDFWMKHNYNMIDRADELWVLQLQDWEESRGVNAEIQYTEKQNKPIVYWNPLNAKTPEKLA